LNARSTASRSSLLAKDTARASSTVMEETPKRMRPVITRERNFASDDDASLSSLDISLILRSWEPPPSERAMASKVSYALFRVSGSENRVVCFLFWKAFCATMPGSPSFSMRSWTKGSPAPEAKAMAFRIILSAIPSLRGLKSGYSCPWVRYTAILISEGSKRLNASARMSVISSLEEVASNLS